ncbi:MAG: thioredoxin-dependent thiol peroxidase [Myxococcales bacterium]|nr:thioredoxin-dependent thiol peroxidase [Myxococcales bacterium]MCB9664616.1 thioredoxin-dependent thiol peroxidase [Alphaproteobacteria bacterium]
MLAIGDQPDDFTLQDQEGRDVRWSSLRGHPVAVFFYPKASTPGCTTEACDFRDLEGELAALGVRVLGISADSVTAQARFAGKHGLAYPLLSDPDHVVLGPWGVWGEKKLYGRVFEGIRRTTFLFDVQGRVVAVWTNVKVKGHADAVLASARELLAP